jgi:DNA helicase-2/ATP-dependent DNA helicase PcrA
MDTIYNQLNEEQRQAVTASADKPLLIVAGAGTGKTTTLTSRIARFIQEGVPASAILATTFTNKAAREMRERLERMLPNTPLGGQNSAFIGTFHSLGARILRENARLSGRTPGFVIYDSSDSFSVAKKIAKELKLKSASQLSNCISKRKRNNELCQHPGCDDGFARYEQTLLNCDAADFDDLILLPVKILSQHTQVQERYRNRFTHFFVDEYQDINAEQYELLKLLAGPAASVTAVGDDQQTIYSWRGSDFSYFLDFQKNWPGAHTIMLTRNYRSGKNILGAANSIIKNNSRQIEKLLVPARDLIGDVAVHEYYGESEEAEGIADSIFQRIARKEEPASIAILYRTNAQSRPLEQAFVERGIPYILWGGLAFYERREIKDILAAVRVAHNPKDTTAVDRLEKNLGKRRFSKVKTAILALVATTPETIIETFLSQSDYLEMVQNSLTNPTERMENIAELRHFAAAFPDTGEFLERTALLQSTDRGHSAGESVHMMTAHMAKGLEFRTVYVAGCAEGLIPHTMSLNSTEELEEERRLLYVAATRAKDSLSLSYTGTPSRFLLEMDPQYYSFIAGDGKKSELTDSEESYITLD